MGKNVHVVRHGSGWATRKEGNERVSSVHTTQNAAINAGRPMAQKERSELVIHGRDGRIRDKDSFGNDPCPPNDKRH